MAEENTSKIHLLGVRHHGPGSSRHVLEALETINPNIILIEGPPEGESMLSWVIHEEMKPPVALLAYVPDNPQKSVFYPFADYSPEWNAIKYGIKNQIPVRFIDMPLTHKLAENTQEENPMEITPEVLETPENHEAIQIRKNPISYLSDIAGFEDAEEWWEHQFEIAHHPIEVFEAIAESMSALRTHLEEPMNDQERIREAFMRKGIRTAEKEKYKTIVVVCGAWHVPALKNMPKAKEDEALIKNLPKIKIEATWIPWTNERLSFDSGYGAGLESPGWYQHCWSSPSDDGTTWLAHTAKVFRNNQVDISSAHIIEAVRLSQSLAGLRALSRPSLREFNEATQTVMCMGDAVLMNVIWRELIVGKNLGSVPEGTPQVPLQKDFEQQSRRLKLKISNEDKLYSLDLRTPNDLERSILLHRLLVLDVHWGRTQYARGKGTFKEDWNLCWQPELTISLLEKAAWGNTIEVAANKYVENVAAKINQLDDVIKLMQKAIPAELQEGIKTVMQRMDVLAATTSDNFVLMNAFVPLVNISRYGNVRKTDLDTIELLLDSVFYRMVTGLPLNCVGIDDEQAISIADKIKEVNQAILILDNEEIKQDWLETILKINALEQASAMIQGTACKILYDGHFFDDEKTAIEFSKALSVNNEPNFSANWLEGFLKDAATILILDEHIWNVVYDWVNILEEDTFVQVVPLLRRTFSAYNSVEKQKIAQKVKHGKAQIIQKELNTQFNAIRAQKVLPILEKILNL